MTSRRNFLKNTAAITAGTLIIPSLYSFSAKKNKNIGLQIYSVRAELEKDLEGTLKELAKIGYKWIETANYKDGLFYGKKPADFKKLINDMGMELISSHCGIDTINTQKTTDDHAEAGFKYVIKPSLPKENRATIDDYRKIADDFNKIGSIVKSSGMKFGYHNHAFEFEKIEEQVPYTILLENTDKDYVLFEVDLYWVVKGGYKPLDFFEKHPGRFELFHIKDMVQSGEYSTEIGTGTINFEEIFNKKELAGMKYFFVEQEKYVKYPAMESMKINFDYLNKAKFVK